MASMSVRNECNKCGKKFLADCESICPDCKKADGDYAVLAEVRAIIDKNSYLINEGSAVERRVCNYWRLMEDLKLKFGSEHFS